MARVIRGALASSAIAILFAGFSCGGPSERSFNNPDASTGGSSGASGSAGSSTGGSAGSSTGGSAGTSTGGSAGSPVDGGKPCQSDPDCDDGEMCNGTETCVNSYCAPGTPEQQGTACTPAVDGGLADSSVQYICVAGGCAPMCDTDDECNDNDVCTGAEICNPTTKTCQSGTPPACDDNDPCTENQCNAANGCFYPIIDGDGDGHASTALGSCGDDCNDNDPDIYAGAAELCDNKDNNCNGQTDELAPTWYVDCDGDTFAPSGAASIQQCNEPTTPHASCNGNGGWTSKAPAAGTTDCWDKDAKAHPMTSAENNTAWQSVPMTGSAPVSIDYDYNCDGTEEKRYPTGYVSSSATCSWVCGDSGICGCSGTIGWTGGPAPACGATGNFTSCSITLGCKRTTSTGKKQECR